MYNEALRPSRAPAYWTITIHPPIMQSYMYDADGSLGSIALEPMGATAQREPRAVVDVSVCWVRGGDGRVGMLILESV